MKIIIADDEWLIRESLKSMLKEIGMNFEAVLEADNGVELVELSREHTPAIAFVDIRMPNLNGLEAIEKLKKISPHTQFIILTGYSEFQYVKEAIKMGVANYLLKPVSIEELKETIAGVIEKNNLNMKSINGEFEKALRDQFYKVSAKEDAVIFGNDATFIGGVFCFDSFLPEEKKQRYEIAFYKNIRRAIDETYDYDCRLGLHILPDGYLVVVGAWDNKKGAGRLAVREFFFAVKRIVEQSIDANFNVTLFSTGECSDFKALNEEIERIIEILPLMTVVDFGHSSNLEALNERSKEIKLLELSKLIFAISETYSEDGYMDFISSINDLKQFVGSGHVAGMLGEATRKFLRKALGIELEPQLEYKEAVAKLECFGDRNRLNSKTQETYDMVSEVKKYVHNNYMNNIGIGDIAEKLNVTPNYLSTLFHKKTDINFLKYLTQYRMRKAKELLAQENKKVQDVAKEVGYFSTRHFTKLFKEQYGYYPSECSDIVKKDKNT